MLQILDNGRLTDAKGRHVNFKNTVIIMTSNIGSEFVFELGKIGFQSEDASNVSEQGERELEKKIRKALEQRFRPEFLNRLDATIIFQSLRKEHLLQIIDLQLELIARRLEKKGVTFTISNQAKNYLIEEGYDPHYGARPLKRVIQNRILNPVAEQVIGGNIGGGARAAFSMKNGELLFD